jgi:hypothetical protein
MMFWVLVLCRLVGRCQRFGETSSGLMMKTVCFFKTLASTDESTRRQNPEEHHHPHHRENLKSHKNGDVHAYLECMCKWSPIYVGDVFLETATYVETVNGKSLNPRLKLLLETTLCLTRS